MTVVFTPGQLTRRASFYQQLGQLTGAGLGVMRALEQLQRHPPSPSWKEPIRLTLAGLNQGMTLGEAFNQAGRWLPELDRALLAAGEQSGRLEQCFRMLSSYYTHRASLIRQLLVDLAYPAFLLHFAALILPFSAFFSDGDWKRYLARVSVVLVPIYAVVVLGIYLSQSGHGEGWRALLEKILRPVPMLGTARYYLALHRLAAALEALLSAGVSIIEAWELAAAGCGSPAVKRTVLSWRPLLQKGSTPAELVSSSSRFPSLFSGQYSAGEVSGKLDETLQGLARYYQEEGSRKLRLFSQWMPRLVYLIIAGAIAWKIVSFYLNYFKMVGDAGGF
jgi:type II secretory pathway component PulF